MCNRWWKIKGQYSHFYSFITKSFFQAETSPFYLRSMIIIYKFLVFIPKIRKWHYYLYNLFWPWCTTLNYPTSSCRTRRIYWLITNLNPNRVVLLAVFKFRCWFIFLMRSLIYFWLRISLLFFSVCKADFELILIRLRFLNNLWKFCLIRCTTKNYLTS